MQESAVAQFRGPCRRSSLSAADFFTSLWASSYKVCISHFSKCFAPRLGPRTCLDAPGSPRYRCARAQREICCVFIGKVEFSSKIRSSSATYPFFRPLGYEYLSIDASTRFVVCFSFCTRSSNMFSVSQSLPTHESSKNG